MANNKISVVAGSHFPAFIQDDYPTFVSFIKAYYEYLEQTNNLTWVADKLQVAFDVDQTLDDFVDYFMSEYLPQFPVDVLADKALLVKNIKSFYLNKGSEKSLKFLFRALYGKEIELFYPNRSILRVSDGKWITEKSIRATDKIINTFVGDGNTSQYVVSETTSLANITVAINGTTLSNSFFSLSNSRILILNSALGSNDTLQVFISGGNFNRFVGNQVFGSNTGASAIVSKYNQIYDRGVFYNELIITNAIKTFELGEEAYTFFIDDFYNVQIKISVPITSAVVSVNLVETGSRYNIGDPAIITGGGGTGANAIVSDVYSSGVEQLLVNNRGAGFKEGVFFNITGGGGSGAIILLNNVDDSGNVHPNTYNVTKEIIQTYANTRINANAYGFPAFANANANTLLSSSFTYSLYGLCGPIDPLGLVVISEGSGYLTPPTIKLPTPIFSVNSSNLIANVPMTDFGIVGSIKINSGGSGYAVGDELIFTQLPSSFGMDVAGAVVSVTPTGSIAKVEIQPPRITGTVNIAAGGNTIIGTGTNFTGDLKANTWVIVNNQIRMVTSVTNNTSVNIANTWLYSSNNFALGVYGRNFIGGSGHEQTKLPLVSVSSVSGTGANLEVKAIIGTGDEVIGSSVNPPGKIKKIVVTQSGSNYTEQPDVDLSGSGDGSATAIAEIAGGLFNYPGYYKNSDGFLSGPNKLQDRDFYQFFSYVIKAPKTLDVYEKILKDMLHPAGLRYFAEYDNAPTNVDLTISVESGGVSVANIS